MVPFISIIIPTYQSERTLRRALESVFSQSFQDFEVLVMDGASTDGTSQIANCFCEQFSRLYFHSRPDHGVYDAMNKGIKLAQGEWLFFLGSDDQLHSSKTLEEIQPVLAGEYDVVYGNALSTLWNGVYDGEFTTEKILQKNLCHQAIFLNRRVFRSFGDYDLQYRVLADWEHNLRWFLAPNVKKVFVNQTIADYADGGLSSRESDKAFWDDRMLLYVAHGRRILSFRLKASILKREMLRAFKTSDWRLLYRVALTASKTFVYLD